MSAADKEVLMNNILLCICIILLASTLGIYIYLCRKKVFSFIGSYEAKKKELNELVIDAEEMVNELNKFSEYIVNQVDSKNEEISKTLKFAEEKVMLLQQRVDNLVISSKNICKTEMISNIKSVSEISEAECDELQNEDSHLLEDGKTLTAMNGDSIIKGSSVISAYTTLQHSTSGLVSKKKEKVIPLNTKYSEVIRMSQQNMSIHEIAKVLNIGKGEVELVLDMRR